MDLSLSWIYVFSDLLLFYDRSILLRLASPMVLLASIYVEILNVDTPPVCGNKRWDDSSSGLTKKIVIKVTFLLINCYYTFINLLLKTLLLECMFLCINVHIDFTNIIVWQCNFTTVLFVHFKQFHESAIYIYICTIIRLIPYFV